jgi:hypothetical protein
VKSEAALADGSRLDLEPEDAMNIKCLQSSPSTFPHFAWLVLLVISHFSSSMAVPCDSFVFISGVRLIRDFPRSLFFPPQRRCKAVYCGLSILREPGSMVESSNSIMY